uniref:Uncharacterized protein n=1 Tax=Davidia involucrata TaxID=16924 RepID=A0A5B7B510_DAVIN
MNSLRRAIAGELLFSSTSSRKCLMLLQSISTLQQSSLYSTTSTSTSSSKNQQQQRYKKPKPQPEQSSPSLSSASFSEVVQKKALVSQGENEKGMEEANNWPRPSEIPWQTKVANSVNLIGRVQIPVQFQASPDGKYWAGTIISQQNEEAAIFSSDSPPFWIPIIFEGDLAHIAACHLKEKDCVYIAGHLSADPPPFTISQGQVNVQVMVCSINFVQGSSQLKKSSAPCKQEELDKNHSASVKDDISVNQSWKDLIAKPHEWWDIRLKKGNLVAAAFEHKSNGQLLCIDDSTPEWIQNELVCLAFDRKIVQENLKRACVAKDGGSWMDLLKNPKQWWDHRENKLNGSVKPKYPDFKHKDSGVALWLDNAPKWVLSELEGLEFDVQLRKMKQVKDRKSDDSWKNLVENPDKWWDNRSGKVNKKSPDFKNKDTGEGLWLDDSPAWVLSRLPPLKTKDVATGNWKLPS